MNNEPQFETMLRQLDYEVWEPDKRAILFEQLLQVGTFDDLVNLHLKGRFLEQKQLLLATMIQKATIAQLLELNKIIVSPSDKGVIDAKIKASFDTKPHQALRPVFNTSNASHQNFDVFICHASEDKNSFVRPLVEKLTEKKITVWYDDFTIKIGDSLRQSIEKGLVNSTYGIVVLSPHFFAKRWPQNELSGLNAKERNGTKVILPVWLNLDEYVVAQFAPMLSDRVAARASDGIDKVVSDLVEVIQPSQ